MEVKILTKKDHNNYINFLNELNQFLFYYSLEYKKFICSILQCKSIYLIAKKNGKIKGALPLMIKDGNLGKVINSLPFYGSHGGILYKNEKAKDYLIKAFKKIEQKKIISSCTLIENPLEKKSTKNIIDHNYSDTRIGQITFFNNLSIDELINKFHFKTRNMIRKALKNNISISIDNDKIDFLKKTHNENMRAIGGISKPDLFFIELEKNFIKGKDYKIYIAKKEQKIISALLVFYHSNGVEYYMPVTKSEYRTLQPLSLIIYNAMKDSILDGFKFWNWGGTWIAQDGVYRFKSRWGTEDINYTYYTKVYNKEIIKSNVSELQSQYFGFFVIPFNELKNNDA